MPIRFGLIGYGFAARTFHLPLIQATPGLEVTIVSTSRADEVAQALPGVMAVKEPTEILRSDAVDAVVVATPHDSHASWATAALQAGKHVVVEKPFALAVGEARALTAMAAARGRLLSAFHNRRWDSDFLSVASAIRAGRIGRPIHFESHFDRYRPQVRQRWREQPGPAGGIWYDLAPHLIDQALQLFGLPSAVEANIATLRTGASAPDWAHAVLSYPAHRVIIHASMVAAGGSPRFTIHGDQGSLIKKSLDRQEAQLSAGMVPGAKGWGEDSDPLQIWNSDGRWEELPALAGDQRHFYRGVLSAIRDGGANPVPGDEASAVVAVIEAGLRSAERGQSETASFSDAEHAAFSRLSTV